MSKKFQIVTLITVLLLGGLAVVWAMNFVSALALVGSFDTSRHIKAQTVGEFSNPDAKEVYQFVTSGTGISFPSGTVVEIHDDGWDSIHCCFIVTVSDYAKFIERFSQSPVTPRERATSFSLLTQSNQLLPASACRLNSEELKSHHSMFADHETNRIWLDMRYAGPFD